MPIYDSQYLDIVGKSGMTSRMLQELLGRNINRYRQLQGFTIEKLAEQVDSSVGHLTDVLHGRTWVSSELLSRISNSLQVPMHSLFAAPDDNKHEPSLLISEIGNELEKEVAEAIRATTSRFLKRINE